MAKANYVQPGRVIDYVNAGSSDIGYREIVPLGTMVGVAVHDIPAGDKGSLEIAGVFEMPATGSAAFTVGQKLYWDAANKVVTGTATDNTACGYAIAAKAEAATAALVKIG